MSVTGSTIARGVTANIVARFHRAIAREPAAPRQEPGDLQQTIAAAYLLLQELVARHTAVPAGVITDIVSTKEAKGAPLGVERETRFWIAYGYLNGYVFWRDRTRRTYMRLCYLALVVLLVTQYFFLADSYIRGKLLEIEKSSAQTQQTTTPVERASYDKMGNDAIVMTERIAGAPLAIARILSFGLIQSKPLFQDPQQRADGTFDSTIIRAKLDMIVDFLGNYVLPMLYGVLGACAFVLRNISVAIDDSAVLFDRNVRYTLRGTTGILAGLAVGWFLRPANGPDALTSLSPFALAFVAGYGSDLFFAALDKIAQVFVSPPAKTVHAEAAAAKQAAAAKPAASARRPARRTRATGAP